MLIEVRIASFETRTLPCTAVSFTRPASWPNTKLTNASSSTIQPILRTKFPPTVSTPTCASAYPTRAIYPSSRSLLLFEPVEYRCTGQLRVRLTARLRSCACHQCPKSGQIEAHIQLQPSTGC